MPLKKLAYKFICFEEYMLTYGQVKSIAMKKLKFIKENFPQETEDPDILIREVIKSDRFPKFFRYQDHLNIFLK